jgi:hypothetical protein
MFNFYRQKWYDDRLDFSQMLSSQMTGGLTSESIEWFIEDKEFLWSNDLAPAPPAPLSLLSKLSLSSFVSAVVYVIKKPDQLVRQSL